MAPRPGFIVKNAVAVGANLDIAEPDALDYNLLGNGRFGVISGCDVTASGSSWTMNVAIGVYVVDGTLVAGGGQVTLPTASQDARFDLIVGDGAGHISAVLGVPGVNPVFPEYDNTVTVFAAVMVRPGITPPQQVDVTDKRVMLPQRFTTSISAGSLLHNADSANGLAPLFDIDWNGKQQWDGDTFLERSGTQSLRVTNNLDVVGTLTAQDLGLDGDLIAAGDVTADNLKVGIVNPTVPGKPGDLYRNTATGSLWLYEGGTWKQLATTPIPAGFTMMGFVTTAPQGWLLVDGSRVTRAAAGGLWDALPAWRTVVGGAEYIQLPDAKDCFFGWGAPGVKGGNPSSSVVISTANMPAHRHLTSPSGQMVGAGAHGHGATLLPNGGHTHVTQPNQGSHGHDLDDPGHFHGAFEGGSGFVAAVWGAPNKLDGLFNDASHTWNVDVIPWTFPAKTGIRTMASDAANHTHSTDNPGNHFHSLSIDQQGTNHTHIINEVTVGSGAPLDIRPPFMGVYLYVKI